jgi:hypothetical protein
MREGDRREEVLHEGMMLRKGVMLCEGMMLCEAVRGDDLHVKIFYCILTSMFANCSCIPEHLDCSARLVIVKANVVRLVHCSSRSGLSLLGSARDRK